MKLSKDSRNDFLSMSLLASSFTPTLHAHVLTLGGGTIGTIICHGNSMYVLMHGHLCDCVVDIMGPVSQ